VNATDIGTRKQVIFVISRHQFFERTDLLAPFKAIHLPFTGDTEQVPEDAPMRPRLELILVKASSIVATFLVHTRQAD
jgi:hypothetical protein